MELGTQIRALRQARGITQETLAERLHVTAQAVSRWERGTAMPEAQLLPALSAYFGVTIDTLFSLSDETRMERIQNMLEDERRLDEEAVAPDRAFLLEKARREPDNAQPHALLAGLENFLARAHQERAAEYAKESLRRDPAQKSPHVELLDTAPNCWPTWDWNAAGHPRLIDWYKDFVAQNPTYPAGYLWLMDLLIADSRLAEAAACCDALAKIDSTYRVPLYRGYIAWAEGDRARAWDLWAAMERDFPDEWCVWFSTGGAMARAGRYGEAKERFRRALSLQRAPRFTDVLEAIAAVCELEGDLPGAIDARQRELALLASDWHIVSGETADAVHREIDRLERKQKG